MSYPIKAIIPPSLKSHILFSTSFCLHFCIFCYILKHNDNLRPNTIFVQTKKTNLKLDLSFIVKYESLANASHYSIFIFIVISSIDVVELFVKRFWAIYQENKSYEVFYILLNVVRRIVVCFHLKL